MTNNQLILIMLIAGFAAPSWSANWKLISRSESEDFSVDIDSISGIPEDRKIYIKANSKTAMSDGSRSRLLQYTVNCKDETFLLESIKTYSVIDLEGAERALNVQNPKRNEAKPKTVGEAFISAACKEKGAPQAILQATQVTNSNSPTATADHAAVRQANTQRNIQQAELQLGQLSPQLSGIKYCGVEAYYGEEKIAEQLVKTPDYSFTFPLNAESTSDETVLIKGSKVGKPRSPESTMPACPITIKIALGDLYAKQWRQWESQEPPNMVACVRQAMEEKYLPYQTRRDPAITVYPSIRHSKARRALDACDKTQKTVLRTNYQCTLALGQRSTCSDQWMLSINGKNSPLELRAAVSAMMDGAILTVGSFETVDGNRKRIGEESVERQRVEKERQTQMAAAAAEEERKQKEKTAKEEAERKRIAEIDEQTRREEEKKRVEEQKRIAWLASPEGKKHLAEEAAKTKAAEQKLAREFPYYAIISCGINSQTVEVFNCFAIKPYTELELRNGNDYGLYGLQAFLSGNIPNSIRMSDGLKIDLRKGYMLTAQNSHTYFHLQIKIYSRNTGEIIYQKAVARFGAIVHGKND